MESTEQKIARVISEQMGIEPVKCGPTANLIDDLGFDGLDQVEMAMAIEEAFDIEIPYGDMEKFNTVGDYVSYVNQAQSA